MNNNTVFSFTAEINSVIANSLNITSTNGARIFINKEHLWRGFAIAVVDGEKSYSGTYIANIISENNLRWRKIEDSGDEMELNSTKFKEGTQLFTIHTFSSYRYADLYLSCWGITLPCIRIFSDYSEQTHCFSVNLINSENYPSIINVKFTTNGRWITNVKMLIRTGETDWKEFSDGIDVLKVVGHH
jgi:hypothetical protein